MELTELWRAVLSELKDAIKKADFLVWFQGTNILKIDEGIAVIGLPSIFAKDWFEKRYKDLILEALKKHNDQIVELKFEIDSRMLTDSRGIDLRDLEKQTKKKIRKLPNRDEVSVGEDGATSKMLNPKYLLSNFVVGDDNRLAHAACCAVARQPGKAYNPLFVYGGVGLGKTHLLQATGNAVLQNYPDVQVVYGTAEKFTNEVVEAIRKSDTRNFQKKYRRVGCLIMDDIQFFANKGKTQEEFFHTINELYDGNKQIIFSSDRPPRELKGIAERLISRFEMGMIVDVSVPDYETRLAILQKKCQEREILLPNDVLEYMAFNCHNSIRELEGVLTQVVAQAKLQQVVPSLNDVQKIFRKLGNEQLQDYEQPRDKQRAITGEEVIEQIATYYKVPKSDLLGADRRRDILLPRQVCMYFLREEFNFSYEKIGELMGRNHTTAMHACQKIVDLLQVDRVVVRDIGAIKNSIGI